MTDLAINEDLIAHYMSEGNLKCLVSIFDFQHRQMTRAEDLSRAYLSQMIVLETRLKEARGEDQVRERSSPREARSSQPVPSASSKPASKGGTAFDLGELE